MSLLQRKVTAAAELRAVVVGHCSGNNSISFRGTQIDDQHLTQKVDTKGFIDPMGDILAGFRRGNAFPGFLGLTLCSACSSPCCTLQQELGSERSITRGWWQSRTVWIPKAVLCFWRLANEPLSSAPQCRMGTLASAGTAEEAEKKTNCVLEDRGRDKEGRDKLMGF